EYLAEFVAVNGFDNFILVEESFTLLVCPGAFQEIDGVPILFNSLPELIVQVSKYRFNVLREVSEWVVGGGGVMQRTNDFESASGPVVAVPLDIFAVADIRDSETTEWSMWVEVNLSRARGGGGG